MNVLDASQRTQPSSAPRTNQGQESEGVRRENHDLYSQAAEHWPCKINPYRLHVFLEGYEETSRKELLDGIRFGFRIESSVPYRLGVIM